MGGIIIVNRNRLQFFDRLNWPKMKCNQSHC